jgi:hypothetical protein
VRERQQRVRDAAAVPGLGGAQYEDAVLIGPDGAELLTALDA